MKPIVKQNMNQQNAIEIALFLVISAMAYTFKDFNLFASASEGMKHVLGEPPPTILIHISLFVYLFSASVIRLISIATDQQPIIKWTHLGYRTIFYVFYCFSGVIAVNFVPVFLIGLGQYTLDQFHVLYYNYTHNENGVYHAS